MMGFLLGTAVFHQPLHYVPVHERLSAKEVHLQMLPVAGIGNEEIQGLLSHLIAHEGAAAMVLAFLCKAVTAGQVAVMGNVQAQCLDHGFPLLKVYHKIPVNILGQELLRINQLLDFLQSLPYILSAVSVLQTDHYIFLYLRRQSSRLFHLRNPL